MADKDEPIRRVVERLKPHWAAIEKHFAEEDAEYRRLVQGGDNHDAVGRVLKSHLLMEHYIGRFLADHYKLTGLSGAKLSFFQKAMLLPDTHGGVAVLKPGILRLNTIRNRLGHRLNVAIEKADLGPIANLLPIMRPDLDDPDPIQSIEAFTTVACTFLVVAPPEVQAVFTDAFSELPAMFKTIDKADS